MKRRFWGVNLGLTIGIIGLLSWISNTLRPSPTDPMELAFSMFRSWSQLGYCLTTTLGCLAYKSLKRRKLGLGASGRARKYVELGLLVMSGLALYIPYRWFHQVPREYWRILMRNDPIPFLLPFVAIAWVVLAYGSISTKQLSSVNPDADSSS